MRTDDKAIFDLDPLEQSPESRWEIMQILLRGIRNIELQLSGKMDPDKRKNAVVAMNYKVELYREYRHIEKKARNANQSKGADHAAEASVGCGSNGEAGA